ncbi:Nif3-like dinuclear metal center hexameric protein [Zoogloea sp.]|uniref:Nif3-like dinuclear metal center hexameric protein n=1 Tax=Zoogloea sp. TaxID=49181 RepID=UPI001D423618|nr:Nif3-like dinuclear metal center hexameric protein [Zoogloea sp.]MBK6654412.1 Nif3-like dinuclear metal center hexameric protein [Zoogloea sp.]HOY02231.1 Nif3-like dinuclear metal center hexameric protein [Zoogloea sp.]
MERAELQRYLDNLLEVGRFRDYSPNGLQVEGRAEIRRIVCGVTASQALLDAALARDADAVLVHHGYFWRGEDACITGLRRKRLGTLLGSDINLFAYHLPLDAHPELGNNAQLGRLMGWTPEGRFGEQDIGWIGQLAQPTRAELLVRQLAARLGREPLLLGEPARAVKRIAWCTGGAQGYFEQAIACGVDCFVSGEASEQTTHLARESGVVYLAVGHHASERYGVQALGAHLAERWGLEVDFVDVDNPV